MARSFRVIGALGTGSFAPVLAEEVWSGGSRRVVLARPAPEAASAASGCLSDRVVGEEGRVTLDGRQYGVFAYAPGVDLDQLVQAGGLTRQALSELAVQIREALQASPVPHGALDGSTIRIDRAGRVRLVGFRGRPDSDVADLGGLIEELEGSVVEGGAALATVVSVDPPDPLSHALSGTTISETVDSSAVPAKVRTAGIAALTLVLGILSGWFLASG